MGLVHIDMVAVRKELPAVVKKFQPMLPPPIAAKIPAVMKTLGKIEAIDVFLLVAGRRWPPMPVAAISGKATPQDVADVLAIFIGAKIPPRKVSAGHHIIGPVETMVIGKRMFLAPIGMLSKDMLALIAAGETKLLTGSLAKVNRKAHAWGGAEGMNNMDKAAPVSVSGSASIGKKLTAKINILFSEVRFAKNVARALSADNPMYAGLLTSERKGASVSVNIDAALPELLASVMRARMLAKRAVSMSNLKNIGVTIAMYMEDQNGGAPPTLAKLVEGQYLPSAQMLLSPNSGRKTMKTDAKGIPTEPSDYQYIVLPNNAPGGLVRAYEDPKLNGDEGSSVLYADTHIEWQTPEQLKKDLAKTHKWLKENSK